MKKSKIVIERIGDDDASRAPGAIIEAKNRNVYSSFSGVVKSIDTTNGRIVIYMESENGGYSFSYHNFETVAVVENQFIKKRSLIGRIKDGERLFLIASKNKDLIDPAKILRCKVIERRL